MNQKIEISHRTVFFITGFLILLWLIIEIRDILFLLFISFIIMSALRPLVEFFERYRIPRALSILSVYAITGSFLALAVSSLIPPLVIQTSRLVNNLPSYLDLVSPYLNIDPQSISGQLAPLSQNIVRVTFSVFSNILSVLTVSVFTFYLLLERSRLERYAKAMFAASQSERFIMAVQSIETGLGTWLRGQLLLMLVVGLLSYIGLTFLKVEYALPLSILAGLFEIVPVIGPLISAVPAVLVAVTTSPFLGLSTAALYFIVQQLENNLIVPLVMNRAVGLSPLIIIVALMIGSRLAGIIGAILSIPIVIVIREVMRVILYYRESPTKNMKSRTS